MAISEAAKAARRQKLVDSAHALIRDSGAGFSMLQLAEHAGVSPATPYNLLGSKSEVLRLVVQDEFERFSARLALQPTHDSALHRLLAAIDLVVAHYTQEPAFYRGLYQATLGTEVRSMMLGEGLRLWCEMVAQAMDSGEIEPIIPAPDLTALLLRAISTTTQAWLADHWDVPRFATEMRRVSRLLLLGLVSASDRQRMLDEMA